MKRIGAVASILAACAVALYLNNSALLAPPRSGKPLLLAHRGLGQSFSREGLTGETCAASRIFPPEHPYIEETLPSIKAAFHAGADIVEFDVQPTTDGAFVVFHDWTLDCRTDGKGVTREHSLAELKALDVGYGYTADGGKTFPFRGKGVGMMASLDEVLAAFPGRRFLINIKSNDPKEGAQLADKLATVPTEWRRPLMVYGAERPIAAFRTRLPDIRTLSTDNAKSCFLRYAALGWSGHVPAACRGTLFPIPINIAPWVWGFPGRLLARMDAVDTPVVLLGPYDGTGFSSGIDDRETMARVPAAYDGIIWSNRIDRIGAAPKH